MNDSGRYRLPFDASLRRRRRVYGAFIYRACRLQREVVQLSAFIIGLSGLGAQSFLR